MAENRLTVKDLGLLINCQSCGKPTYRSANLTKEGVLPDGFTSGNSRHTVYRHSMRYTLCANCRYDEPWCRY